MKEIDIICKTINEIIIDILKGDIDKLTSKIELDEDIKALIKHLANEFKNCYELCASGNTVSSMILLRSTFENMLFSMDVIYNPQLLNEYKKLKNSIKPKDLKKEIIENWDKYFTDIMESQEQTKIEIKNIYDLLSKFTHPNCIRTTTCMMEDDKQKIGIVKNLYMQNITSVILIYVDFIHKFLNINDELIYSFYLYELLCLVIHVQINKDKVSELKKYNDYMYIHTNENEINYYYSIINQEINEISQINNDSWKIIIENLQRIINKSQYKEEVKKINEKVIVLLNVYNKDSNK